MDGSHSTTLQVKIVTDPTVVIYGQNASILRIDINVDIKATLGGGADELLCSVRK